MCSRVQDHQFDFWIGRWTVYDRIGKTWGRSLIEPLFSGCAIRETWAEPGLKGTSLNAYTVGDGQWRQFWVDTRGGAREFVGGLDSQGAMVLIAQYPSQKAPGATVRDRMTFSRGPHGSVRQYAEASIDGGVTWKPLYDNDYRRRRR